MPLFKSTTPPEAGYALGILVVAVLDLPTLDASSEEGLQEIYDEVEHVRGIPEDARKGDCSRYVNFRARAYQQAAVAGRQDRFEKLLAALQLTKR